jgi:mannose/cellobiose epimerase-like protein (N-acyl-D-glucosamine 2-epimerase family)
LGRDGGIIDPVADLYDLAFVLFALAWYARATHEPEPLEMARATLRWIEEHMALPDELGYDNTWPLEAGPRQQNPHMHLLEASLALFETSGDMYFLDVAERLVTLFKLLYDPASGTLAEFYGTGWKRGVVDGAVRVEPGHLYEWVWLLVWYARLSGHSMSDYVKGLYAFANRYGFDQTTGLVFNAVASDGRVLDRAARIWPQTEAIKAHLAMFEFCGIETSATIEAIIANMQARFWNCMPRGTWIEEFSPDGVKTVDKIPASSLYHMFLAYAELDRVAALHIRRE